MPDPTDVVSRDLTARAALMAERLATLLEDTCTVESGAPQTADFLRSWAADAGRTARPEAAGISPLDTLVARYRLTDDEHDLLLLAGLPEEHEGLAGTFRALHPRGEPRPTVGLGALLLGGDRPAVRRRLVEGAAVRHGVLRVVGDGPFFERALVGAEALWEALHGHDAWPADVERVEPGPVWPGLETWVAAPATRRAVAALAAGADEDVLVATTDQAAGLARCAALGAAAGTPVVAGRIPPSARASLRMLVLHAAVRGSVPVLLLGDGDRSTGTIASADLSGTLLVCAPSGGVRPSRRVLRILDAGPVDTVAAWRAGVPHLADRAAELAVRHPLDPAAIAEVGADLRARRTDDELVDLGAVTAAVRARAGSVLPAGVRLLRPTTGWDRLVLPVEADRGLHDAVSRLGHQALVLEGWGMREHARAHRGIRLLFTGPPGTGKSFAAEVVATAAGTDLLVVDLSAVVSKWVGETEKNLAVLFDVAENTGAVLMLDEADALFGARTEVGDAHDRYANLQTAYLLQRLDTFGGLAVLATNLRQNVDAAFLRRMDFVVDFPVPEPDGRHALWELHLPADRRARDVDLEALARLYPVPGGWIRNAAIGAAFLAAPASDVVGQAQLVAAMRQEYAKASRPFPEPTVPRVPVGAVAHGRRAG